MRSFAILFAALSLSLVVGCSSFSVTEDDDLATGDQALEADGVSCKDQCKEEFHACRESPDRGGGPGNSACAHAKNDCESDC